jgi:hypothetical protein
MKDRRLNDAFTIICRQMNRTIDLAWNEAYAQGFAQITGSVRESSALPHDIKHAVSVYFTISDYPQEQRHVKNMIVGWNNGQRYRPLQLRKNRTWLAKAHAAGLDTRPWLHSPPQIYQALSMSGADRKRREEHFEEQIKMLADRYQAPWVDWHTSHRSGMHMPILLIWKRNIQRDSD